MMRTLSSLMMGFLILNLAACGIQSIPQSKNAVEAAMAEVNNQYKRRSDLIPNLVQVVKAYAKQEQETLTAVVEARAKATQSSIDPSKMSAQKLAEFQQAQGALSQALGRLMVVVEKYPDLKADQRFRDLQAQLEGTENRITVARNRYIESIRVYNDLLTVPPTSWTNSLFYKYEKMPQWAMDEAEQKTAEKAPKVEF
jgi:LemA protein